MKTRGLLHRVTTLLRGSTPNNIDGLHNTIQSDNFTIAAPRETVDTFQEKTGLKREWIDFLRSAVWHAQEREMIAPGTHVSAQQICDAVNRLARFMYGSRAGMRLCEWGITSWADVGRSVYALIEVGAFRGSDEGSITDYDKIAGLDGLFVDKK